MKPGPRSCLLKSSSSGRSGAGVMSIDATTSVRVGNSSSTAFDSPIISSAPESATMPSRAERNARRIMTIQLTLRRPCQI